MAALVGSKKRSDATVVHSLMEGGGGGREREREGGDRRVCDRGREDSERERERERERVLNALTCNVHFCSSQTKQKVHM